MWTNNSNIEPTAAARELVQRRNQKRRRSIDPDERPELVIAPPASCPTCSLFEIAGAVSTFLQGVEL